MDVNTTRFGLVTIAEDKVLTFPRGLLGFPSAKRFCVLEPAEEACFFWLQSLDDPSLAFIITDPNYFVPDYSVPIRQEQMDEMGLTNLTDVQTFVIVNKQDNLITGNLQGPLVVNMATKNCEQFVLSEKRWTTRHTLMRINVTPGQSALSA